MFFSVLIPVYNAEKYLDACLRSVIDQTEQDFEIVLCDDGSTDGSLPICRQYSETHSNVRVAANRENRGLLLTRRRLFAMAEGEYAVCVDGDDELEPNALCALKEAILKTGADIVVFNAICIHQDRSMERFVPALQPDHLYEGSEKTVCYDALFQNRYLNSLCTKAIHRKLIDRFTDYEPWKPLSLGEDRFQSLPLFDKAAGIYYLDQALYRYCKRENSITTSKKPRFYEMQKMLWEREDQYISAWHLRKEVVETAYRNRCNEIINYAKSSAAEKTYSAFAKEMDQIRQDGWFSRALKETHLSGRYRIYSGLLSCGSKLLLYTALRIENQMIQAWSKKDKKW